MRAMPGSRNEAEISAPTDPASRGRLFGRNVLDAYFRAAPDEDLFVGELLVGVDEPTGRRYLFRVVDVTYGSEHQEPGWAERVAGTLLADDLSASNGLHAVYDHGRRSYRIAECRCLGYLTPDGGDFRKPKSLPSLFSRVVSPEPEDFAFLRSRMGDLAVGHLRSGETEVDFEVGIPGTSLASHVGIFATTGMGKSNLMQVLAGATMAAQGRYALLLVDPHGEYRPALSRHPWAGERLRVYCARSVPATTALRLSLGELTVDDLRTAYEWTRPQEEALFELERYYGRGGSEGLAWLLDFSRVEDLADLREHELQGRIALNTMQVVHRRARRIVDLPCISTDPAVSVGASVLRDLEDGRIVLVDVAGLGPTEEVLVASFLARRVMDRWSTAYLEERERHERMPVVAVVLEEAQRVLSSSKDRDDNIFPRLAREGRKFKVGLCAVTQQPKLIDGELLSQFNTFFVLGLADERDRNILRGSSKQDLSSLGQEIQTLMPGEALLANLAAPFAVPVKVHLYDLVAATAPPPPTPRRFAPNVSALVD